jgi:DNA-binding MurR/RpiR family transcriptional regulator
VGSTRRKQHEDGRTEAASSDRSKDLDGRTDLEARIAASWEQLTSKQQRIARFMANNQFLLLYGTAEAVARQVDVDPATVVRFSQTIGYAGYADLRRAVREQAPEFLATSTRLQRSMNAQESPWDVMSRVWREDIANIERTVSLNSQQTLLSAVSRLTEARRTYVLGFGMSGYVASSLAHQLALAGIPVFRIAEDSVDAAIQVASISPEDVLVVITVWGYAKHSVSFARVARERGISTLGLTDSKFSPIAPFSDILLLAATESPELSFSVSALISLTNILATGVLHAKGSHSLDHLAKVDDTYTRIDLISE